MCRNLAADPFVEADAFCDLLDVGADGLAEIGDFVDVGDLERQKRIAGIFDEFRRPAIGEEDRRLVQKERPIDVAHHRAGAIVRSADDDPVGVLEVRDRGAFAQEFRIGDDDDVGVRPFTPDDRIDFVAGCRRARWTLVTTRVNPSTICAISLAAL